MKRISTARAIFHFLPWQQPVRKLPHALSESFHCFINPFCRIIRDKFITLINHFRTSASGWFHPKQSYSSVPCSDAIPALRNHKYHARNLCSPALPLHSDREVPPFHKSTKKLFTFFSLLQAASWHLEMVRPDMCPGRITHRLVLLLLSS